MSCKVRRLRETLVAIRIGTDVGLFACVCPQVSTQVEVQRELLSTDLASVGLLSLGRVRGRRAYGVDQLVPL